MSKREIFVNSILWIERNVIMAVTYCLISPFPFSDTMDLLKKMASKVGDVIQEDSRRGYILAKYKVSAFRKLKLEFFVERNEKDCNVRAIFHGDVIVSAKDKWWDLCLSALFELAPNTDFGVSLAEKNPYVIGLLYLEDDTEQIHISRTKQNTSLTGFLLGGALFGDAGAIVGGMSGKQRTVSHTVTQFSNSQLTRLIYNNGRLWEGSITKGSKLYNEIMVNFK